MRLDYVLQDTRMRQSHLARVFLFLLILGVVGCSRKPVAPPLGTEAGIASWYGKPYDGRNTASGEIFDMEKMTAAHRTYPFGTVVRVVNQTNNKVVEVRINDRGPFVAGRIIDLSHGAAQAISMASLANVRLEVISKPRTRAAENFAVQVGEFQRRDDAKPLLAQMQSLYGTASLVFRAGDQTWRVLVGMLPTVEAANALSLQLEKQSGPAFVVLLDQEE
jgi:rare lipoprotein A